MSQIKRLPDELAEFLRQDGPQTLLIRGDPGTGKTSLCFEMLHEFAGKRLYVTCRVAPAKIRQHFHWMAGPDPVEWKLLDLTSSPSSLEEAASVLVHAHELLSASRDNADALRALWLPGAIQDAWGDTDPAEPTLIVIDPWNAFVEQYAESGRRTVPEGPSIRDLERTLIQLIGRTKIHLAFVMEGGEPTHLDFLVDGVVVTHRERGPDHVRRWLNLSKLRGVAINLPLYPFTLDEGLFQCITPTEWPAGLSAAAPEPDPGPIPGTLWPGNADFARRFGRLPAGSLTLFELAPEVPREVAPTLLTPILAEVLGRGGRAMLIPPPTLSPADSYADLATFVPADALESRLRILGVFPNQVQSDKFRSVFVPPHRISWTKDGVTVPVPEDPAFRVGSGDRTAMNLLVVYFSGIEGLAQSAGAVLTREAIPGAAHVTFGGSPVHLIALGRSGDPYFDAISPLAGLHLRIESRLGRILIHGYRPFTEEFAVTQSGPAAPYRLLRLN